MNQQSDAEPSSADQQPVIEFLRRREAYAESTPTVEEIDTHISCVFLTERFVYKLKKQLRFDFLDYSTLQRRQWACRQEVELNRRLAPNVYLGLTAVTRQADGSLALDGNGEPVEWLVKMVRLPATATLMHGIGAGRTTAEQIRTLGEVLERFYRQQSADSHATDDDGTGRDYRDRLRSHVVGNRDELREKWPDTQLVDRIHRLQLRLLSLAPEVFDVRVQAGKVIDGHGDLRPEHIYFMPEPVIIDCIEFSADFRRLDVLDELAFLAIECEMLGAPWIGQQVLAHYRQASGDAFEPLLLDFYTSYRACVRAKVYCLRAAQVEPEQRLELVRQTEAYLDHAERHAERLNRPLMLVVYGLSGSGKSTIAAALAKELDLEVLATDAIRRQVVAATDPAGRYSAENRQRVYEALFTQAQRRLSGGDSILLDGTFQQAADRQQAVEIARRNGALPLLVRCTCSAEVALQRIAGRAQAGSSLSEATAEVYRLQQQAFQSAPVSAAACSLNTERALAANVEEILSLLGGRP